MVWPVTYRGIVTGLRTHDIVFPVPTIMMALARMSEGLLPSANTSNRFTVQMLQHRDIADYDSATKWTRTDAIEKIESVEAAFESWRAIRNEHAAQNFLVTLLLRERKNQAEVRWFSRRSLGDAANVDSTWAKSGRQRPVTGQNALRLDADTVVYGSANPLFAAEITFGGLHRNMS